MEKFNFFRRFFSSHHQNQRNGSAAATAATTSILCSLLLAFSFFFVSDDFLLFSSPSFSSSSSSSSSSSVIYASAYEWEEVSDRDGFCEVCQVLCEIVDEQMEKRRPPSPPVSKVQSRQKSGLLDVAIQEILQPGDLCTFGRWKPYADLTENMFVYDMTANCKKITDDIEETLEEQFAKPNPSKLQLRKTICVANKYCKSDESLWSSKDEPKNRETKEQRNLRLAKLFFDHNRNEKGVMETKSGLQYRFTKKASSNETKTTTSGSEEEEKLQKKKEEEKEEKSKENGGGGGGGDSEEKEMQKKQKCVESTDEVEVNYRGKLLNGKEFDSSYKRKESATFSLREVVEGFREGLMLMCEGDELTIFIPPHLGYGPQGAGKDIGPSETITFDLHLLKVIKGEVKKESKENTEEGGKSKENTEEEGKSKENTEEEGKSKENTEEEGKSKENTEEEGKSKEDAKDEL